MFYTYVNAPRANPQDRLDQPYNIVKSVQPYGKRVVVQRCLSRDDAEWKLHKLAQRKRLIKQGDFYVEVPAHTQDLTVGVVCFRTGLYNLTLNGQTIQTALTSYQQANKVAENIARSNESVGHRVTRQRSYVGGRTEQTHNFQD